MQPCKISSTPVGKWTGIGIEYFLIRQQQILDIYKRNENIFNIIYTQAYVYMLYIKIILKSVPVKLKYSKLDKEGVEWAGGGLG